MNNPWECPRCNKINAPWMPQCNCQSFKEDVAKERKKMHEELNRLKKLCPAPEIPCLHQWDPIGYCLKCGLTKSGYLT